MAPEPSKAQTIAPPAGDAYDGFLDAIGQKDKRIRKAAVSLLKLLPWELTAAGKPSRLDRSDEQVEHAVLRVLSSTGAARNNSLRLSLEKMRKFLDERSPEGTTMPFFPMDTGLLESFKDWLETINGGKSAAADLSNNVDYMRVLGLPVPPEEELEQALKRRTRRAPAAMPRNARNPPGPKMCIDVERLSISGLTKEERLFGETDVPLTKSGEYKPLQVYAMGLVVMAYGTDRGDGVWAATYRTPAPGEPAAHPDFISYRTQLDKGLRVDVDQPVFIGGFEVERHPLLKDFSTKMDSRPCLPYFSRVDCDSKSPELSQDWAAADGKLALAPWNAEASAKASLDKVRRVATGISEAEMKKNKWSGTHPGRHVGPTVAGLLSWPDPEVDALGD